MTLYMIKFGNILNSRPSGKETVLRAKQIITGANDPEDIVMDFTGVEVLTPSFADEFVRGLKELYPDRKITYKDAGSNPVTKDTLTAIGLVV